MPIKNESKSKFLLKRVDWTDAELEQMVERHEELAQKYKQELKLRRKKMKDGRN